VEVGNAAGEVCRLTGERILIAVSGRPHRPEIPGAELGWMKRLLASGNVSLIDVRTPAEYRAGHIAGAINRPLNDLSRHVAEISPEREVVLYCSSGFRSAMGVMALQLEGRHQVKGFAPSIEGWKAAGEPVVTTEGA
jgi:rhodanese-related sulfurtransferase